MMMVFAKLKEYLNSVDNVDFFFLKDKRYLVNTYHFLNDRFLGKKFYYFEDFVLVPYLWLFKYDDDSIKYNKLLYYSETYYFDKFIVCGRSSFVDFYCSTSFLKNWVRLVDNDKISDLRDLVSEELYVYDFSNLLRRQVLVCPRVGLCNVGEFIGVDNRNISVEKRDRLSEYLDYEFMFCFNRMRKKDSSLESSDQSLLGKKVFAKNKDLMVGSGNELLLKDFRQLHDGERVDLSGKRKSLDEMKLNYFKRSGSGFKDIDILNDILRNKFQSLAKYYKLKGSRGLEGGNPFLNATDRYIAGEEYDKFGYKTDVLLKNERLSGPLILDFDYANVFHSPLFVDLVFNSVRLISVIFGCNLFNYCKVSTFRFVLDCEDSVSAMLFYVSRGVFNRVRDVGGGGSSKGSNLSVGPTGFLTSGFLCSVKGVRKENALKYKFFGIDYPVLSLGIRLNSLYIVEQVRKEIYRIWGSLSTLSSIFMFDFFVDDEDEDILYTDEEVGSFCFPSLVNYRTVLKVVFYSYTYYLVVFNGLVSFYNEVHYEDYYVPVRVRVFQMVLRGLGFFKAWYFRFLSGFYLFYKFLNFFGNRKRFADRFSLLSRLIWVSYYYDVRKYFGEVWKNIVFYKSWYCKFCYFFGLHFGFSSRGLVLENLFNFNDTYGIVSRNVKSDDGEVLFYRGQQYLAASDFFVFKVSFPCIVRFDYARELLSHFSLSEVVSSFFFLEKYHKSGKKEGFLRGCDKNLFFSFLQDKLFYCWGVWKFYKFVSSLKFFSFFLKKNSYLDFWRIGKRFKLMKRFFLNKKESVGDFFKWILFNFYVFYLGFFRVSRPSILEFKQTNNLNWFSFVFLVSSVSEVFGSFGRGRLVNMKFISVRSRDRKRIGGGEDKRNVVLKGKNIYLFYRFAYLFGEVFFLKVVYNELFDEIACSVGNLFIMKKKKSKKVEFEEEFVFGRDKRNRGFRKKRFEGRKNDRSGNNKINNISVKNSNNRGFRKKRFN